MSDAPGFVALPPIRAQARAAVARAWDRAIASGALPDFPADATRPTVEIERPADPAHGDFASNLAMKLARPYRMAPLAIAQALATEVDEGSRGRSDPRRSRRRVAPPGFLNLRLRDGALEATVAAILADPRRLGPVAATHPVGQRRVRVGQPDRTAPHRERARGVHRRHAQPRPRSRRPAGHSRVLLQRSGAQIRNLGASVAALRRGEPVPEDGYQGDYVHELATPSPTTSGGRDAPGADTVAISDAGPRVVSARGSRSASSALGVQFDVWTSEARLHDEGWVARAVERCASADTSTSRTARLVPLDRLRRRQGPGHLRSTASRPTSPPTSAT